MKLPVTCCTLLVLLTVASAAKEKPRFVVSREQIADAVRLAGVDVSPANTRVLAPVFASSPNASVEPVAFDSLSKTETLVRVQCHHRSECIPFYVILEWSSDTDADRAMNAWHATRSGSTRPTSENGSFVIRAGQKATLIIMSEKMRIEMPVLCLQSARLGEKLRVTSPDRKQHYVGKVLGPALLQCSL